ncbi:sensor histidine kinase [Novosphingobium soli]|uniref:Signal transduction histidine kinase dimerisation/phosphoacceptor domain-containing protein n=1 Tax=Novosphingobium soli TaxID=574956 RepID=A0ABV6CVC4_9SPHN
MSVYPAAIALCALVMGLTAPLGPGAAAVAAAAAGALFVLNRPLLALCICALLVGGLFLVPGARKSTLYWTDLVIIGSVAAIPRRWATGILRAPRWSWAVAMVCGCLSLALRFALVNAWGANAWGANAWGDACGIVACLCAMFIGAGIARHLAMIDARLLAWGDGGMVQVTRDLLLGRITSGMLHDLAQPLNVISMANGNMDYIIAHLDIDEESRRQLQERVKRIATHTEGTAHILGLFRWFGRDAPDGRTGDLTVRHALDCALAATKSNVRHHGVAVRMSGNALDHLVPEQHGALEMMAVAALLSAFASFIDKDGKKHRGEVLLHAVLTPAHIVITVECTDAQGKPMRGRRIDNATLWLVEQVARKALAEFRCVARQRQPVRFIIRLGRDDI